MADARTFTVVVPPGLHAGQTFTVQAPDGFLLNATVPDGLGAGMEMSVEAPPVVQAVVVQGASWEADGEVDDGGEDDLVVTAQPVSGLAYFPTEVLQVVTGTPETLMSLPHEGAEAFAEQPPAPSQAATEAFDNGWETGILSFDENLCTVDELTRFFQTHNTKPGMRLKVHGYHKKRKTTGSGKKRKTRTVTVTDFRYSFDLDELVAPFGYMQATPDAMGEPRKLSQVLEEYIGSTNALKEINCHKHVDGFDTTQACTAVEEHLRQVLGFRRRISVTVSYPNSTVKVVTPTRIAKVAQCTKNHPCAKLACLCTCTCLVWYPLIHVLGDKQDQIYSNFVSTTNATTWLRANLHRLHCTRGQGTPLGGSGAWDVDRRVVAPPPSFPFMRPVVATGWGVAPNAPVVQVPLDTNGDGRIDAYGTDTTGDGQVDTIVPISAPMERL